MLKLKGYHPARELARKLGERVQSQTGDDPGGEARDREPGDGETR
jgi:hypothetical protein